MTSLIPPRTCPSCGFKGVIPAGEDDFQILICCNCFMRYEDDNGILMTANRGPNPEPRELPPHPSYPFVNPKSNYDMARYFERRSDYAAEAAAQQYIDRMIDDEIVQCYDLHFTPPIFTPPHLWMLGMGTPIEYGAPHELLRRARLSELFNPNPPSE